MFGSSSEKIDAAQLELLLLLQMIKSGAAVPDQSANALNKTSQPDRPRKERTLRVPQNLPVVDQIIEPQEVIKDPEQSRLIGQEVSEHLDYEPAHFLRRRIVRKKYVHVTDPDRAPILAALPEKLRERGRPWIAGPHFGQQVLRSSSALPSGTNLRSTRRKRSVSPAMALKLGRLFDVSPSIWTGLQNGRDLESQARRLKPGWRGSNRFIRSALKRLHPRRYNENWMSRF